MFISQRGCVGASVYSGRALEVGNELQKERNLSSAVLDSLLFTELLQPLMHVYRTWKASHAERRGAGRRWLSAHHCQRDRRARCLLRGACGHRLGHAHRRQRLLAHRPASRHAGLSAVNEVLPSEVRGSGSVHLVCESRTHLLVCVRNACRCVCLRASWHHGAGWLWESVVGECLDRSF